MTRRAAATWVAVAVVAAVGVVLVVLPRSEKGVAADAPAPTATAPVVRTDLARTAQLTGSLGFGAATSVPGQAVGTLTAVPAPGTVVRPGQTLFELDGEPVVLLTGARPAWRPLAPGVTRGRDVRQLERALVALGFAHPATLTVDDTYTWATAQAVRRWQRATHQTVTGDVPFGSVVFAPHPVRVVAAQQPLGTLLQPGQAVLTVSAPTSVVTLDVPVAQASLVRPGDRVSVTLPSGSVRPGRVVAVSSVATEGSGSDASGGSGPPPGPSQAPQQVQVAAEITLEGPIDRADAALDQAPVTVTITDLRVHGVLAVPITALVALSGGGYAVWVDGPGARHLVPVTPGLFATSLVQVTAAGLAVGDEVEVPSS